jgi:predicted transposase/invertase (TIGR01784 family)
MTAMNTTTEEPVTPVTINPFVDWGFKYVFGREETKDLLIGFLNLLLKPEVPFTDITYLNPEVIPERKDMKRCVFDVLCRDAEGERYLIEMQKAWRQDMSSRLVYYLCRLIDRMGRHSEKWEYGMIKRVYGICLMDFTYEEHPQLRHDIMLRNQDGSTYSDLLNIITLQIPCIQTKSLADCKESYEILLNLLNLTSKKMKTKEELLKEIDALEHVCEDTKEMFRRMVMTMNHGLTPIQLSEYMAEVDEYEATFGLEASARLRGLREGRKERSHEIARAMKEKGIDPQVIADCTGLSESEIIAL